MSQFPLVTDVVALPDMRLLVTFENGERRSYDCSKLLDRGAFTPLRDEAFFRGVQPDPHGFGVLWSDEVDLAEAELWLNGSSDLERTDGAP